MADLSLKAGTNITLTQDDDDLYINNNIDLTNYIQNTDYATQNNAGIIKGSNAYGVAFDGANIRGQEYNYTDYQSKANTMFISKGTLENVITGKDLTTKTYVDGLVGDIATTLDTIQGEVI